MGETINITVLVGGRPYSLRVSSDEERVVRRVVEEINHKLQHFQAIYHQQSKQDCLSMVLLTYAVDFEKYKSENYTPSSLHIIEKIDSLNELLEGALLEGFKGVEM